MSQPVTDFANGNYVTIDGNVGNAIAGGCTW
jgi:hypothetical protein